MRPYNFKREEEEKQKRDTLKTANLLLSLSFGSHAIGKPQNKTKRMSAAVDDGVFECKTCSRRFATFQALGGHRTSHNRARSRPDGLSGSPRGVTAPKARVHACAVCGAGFSMGQALGGHMRRHRAAEVADFIGNDGSADKVVDLNKSTSEDGYNGGSEYRLLELFV